MPNTDKFYVGIGSQHTPKDIKILMSKVAFRLAEQNYVYRSGGMPGADQAFGHGADGREEFYDYITPLPAAYETAHFFHPDWGNLDGDSQKEHARTVHRILGKDLNTPCDFVIYWYGPNNLRGIRMMAVRVAESRGIPCHQVQEYFDKL